MIKPERLIALMILLGVTEFNPKLTAVDFRKAVQPILADRCITCHNSEDREGELDLSHWTNQSDLIPDTEILEQIRWQLKTREMPPASAPPLTEPQRKAILEWIDETENEIALQQAGDPGPVVVRRLSNHEYNYTIRDLTGLNDVDPTREFPVDGAAGEGFTNVGSALVMSPGLLNKYLDAAKDVASRAVFLPEGIRFSESTSRTDWAQEEIDAIRNLYGRYTAAGGSQSQNLQGVQFDTVDAGVIPLKDYFIEILESNPDAKKPAKEKSTHEIHARLSEKYLQQLRSAAHDKNPSILVADFQQQLSQSTVTEMDAILDWIARWQQSLWHFAKVGHIGKRDSPGRWQNAVSPFATQQRLLVDLSSQLSDQENSTTLYLAVHSAGDGTRGDEVVWNDAKIVTKNKLEIPLDRSEKIFQLATEISHQHLSQTHRYLALIEKHLDETEETLQASIQQAGLNSRVALVWIKLLQLTTLPKKPTGHLLEKVSNVGGYKEIRGWGKELPTLLANHSQEDLSFSTLHVPARGVTVHPTPEIDAIVDWQSPQDGIMKIDGWVADVDSVCGNGIEWAVHWFHRHGMTELSRGSIANGDRETFSIEEPLQIQRGDLVRLIISPKDKSHVCDTTQIELKIQGLSASDPKWTLSSEIVDRIHEGNPLSDHYGNADVWHFCRSDSESKDSAVSVIHPSSRIASYLQPNGENRQEELREITDSLLKPNNPSDTITANHLKSLAGPFPWLQLASEEVVSSSPATALKQRSPSVRKYRIPSEIAETAQFTATVSLETNSENEGSVQVEADTVPIIAQTQLRPGNLVPVAQTAGTSWTDSQRTVVTNRPILIHPNGPAQDRLESTISDFRKLFPAALCYSRIVPIDEVVTLTLMYREDDVLQELMLSEAETHELERHWNRLEFISRHAYKQRDAYEQLWQYATQDADPSAFEVMRDPIYQAVDQFEEDLARFEPLQLTAVIELTDSIWRRPRKSSEEEELRDLYSRFRTQDLDHEAALRQLLTRLLMAPDFLYRVEEGSQDHTRSNSENNANSSPRSFQIRKLSDWELASRLSYFLWSSCPDEALHQLAESNRLSDPEQLKTQVRRMLSDTKAKRLATEFGCQWLGVRNLATSNEKSERHFPNFSDLKGDMQEEVIRFWTYLLQNQRSPLELIQSDTTFVNQALADHYDLTVSNSGWHQIEGLESSGRGGALAFAATLSQYSGASRTSPILRGNWISETLLGERLPKPPKDVPVLPETAPNGLTERELIEKHSSDQNCARCHEKIDPYGFALEAFDAIGRYRKNQNTQTVLPSGENITGLNGLQDYLVNHRSEDFLRQFAKKLLGYALGRSTQLSDRPLIEKIVNQLKSSRENSIEDAIVIIVQSQPFTHIRTVSTSGASPQDTNP